jgi:hypothetical protein
MGSWGTGIFQDDSAFDVIIPLLKAEYPIEFIDQVLTAACAQKPLLQDTAVGGLTAAAIVDLLLHKTYAPLIEKDLNAWLSAHMHFDVVRLRIKANEAIKSALDPTCELYKLWSQSQSQDFIAWKNEVESMRIRLNR